MGWTVGTKVSPTVFFVFLQILILIINVLWSKVSEFNFEYFKQLKIAIK